MPEEPLVPQEHDPLIALEDREVPAGQREEIFRQIEAALERRRSPLGPESLVVHPRKRGILFPLVVNAAALALVAGGVLLLLRTFSLRQEGIALQAGTYLSAEGRLLQELKEETSRRLAAKDAEIAVIQGRLQALGEQSATLKSGLEQELRAREQALRQEIDGRVAAERARLASLGTPAAGIDRRVEELQRQGQRQVDSEIGSFRRELEQKLAQQEAALREAREQARAALDQAGRDRSQVLEDSRAREAQIRGQFERESLALRGQAQAAEERAREAEQALRRLADQMETQRLLADQIDEHLLRALAALEAGVPGGALTALDALEGLLQSEAAGALPAGRRELDRRLSTALRDLGRARLQRPGGTRDDGAGAAAQTEPAVAGLQAELSRARSDLAQVQSELAGARSELAGRDRQIRVLEARLSRTAQSGAGGAAAGAAGAAEKDLQARLDRLGAQLKASEERAARLASQLEAARSDQAAAEQSARAAREEGLAAGREAALKDVMRYLAYITGNAEQRKSLEDSLLALVRQDPLYRAVTREVQLLAPGGPGGEAGNYVFLGVVSAVSGPTIVVDPMTERSVSAGALVQLRRSSELDREQMIGTGKVLQVRGGKITVLVDGGGSAPAVRDMAYVESRP